MKPCKGCNKGIYMRDKYLQVSESTFFCTFCAKCQSQGCNCTLDVKNFRYDTKHLRLLCKQHYEDSLKVSRLDYNSSPIIVANLPAQLDTTSVRPVSTTGLSTPVTATNIGSSHSCLRPSQSPIPSPNNAGTFPLFSPVSKLPSNNGSKISGANKPPPPPPPPRPPFPTTPHSVSSSQQQLLTPTTSPIASSQPATAPSATRISLLEEENRQLSAKLQELETKQRSLNQENNELRNRVIVKAKVAEELTKDRDNYYQQMEELQVVNKQLAQTNLALETKLATKDKDVAKLQALQQQKEEKITAMSARLQQLQQQHQTIAWREEHFNHQLDCDAHQKFMSSIVKTSVLDLRRKRFAILFGNKNYADSPLCSPERDICELSAKLETSCHFNIIVPLFNLTKTEMLKKLKDFAAMVNTPEELEEGRLVMFYFSGHGCLKKGQQYLCGIEEKQQWSLSSLLTGNKKDDLLALKDVVALLDPTKVSVQGLTSEQIRNRNTNVIVVDACRSSSSSDNNTTAANSTTTITTNNNNDIDTDNFRLPHAPASLLIFACQPFAFAYDGHMRSSEFSLFTQCLLGALRMSTEIGLIQVFEKAKQQLLEDLTCPQGQSMRAHVTPPQIINNLAHGDFMLQYGPKFVKHVQRIRFQIMEEEERENAELNNRINRNNATNRIINTRKTIWDYFEAYKKGAQSLFVSVGLCRQYQLEGEEREEGAARRETELVVDRR